ncbi:MAG TPA: polyphenol oxidase family protein [Solirubrobacterales bacterium]|nr:polyphenol oxidase family protein [Solirubrobacterales bacterium]
MEWREAEGVKWLEAPLPGAKVAFSTRSAGSVKDDLRPFANALGLAAERVSLAPQVHGAELAFPDRARDEADVEADGHVIEEPGSAALVLVADCLPVAVAGPGGTAMLHCGWRGLAAGIAGRGAEAVGATHAVIGPGIGPCCYEVGPEVLAAFSGIDADIAADRMLDLPEVARRLLRDAGVEEIESADLCTCCEEKLFFSHRRDGDPRRQAGLAWIEEEGRRCRA